MTTGAPRNMLLHGRPSPVSQHLSESSSKELDVMFSPFEATTGPWSRTAQQWYLVQLIRAVLFKFMCSNRCYLKHLEIAMEVEKPKVTKSFISLRKCKAVGGSGAMASGHSEAKSCGCPPRRRFRTCPVGPGICSASRLGEPYSAVVEGGSNDLDNPQSSPDSNPYSNPQ